MRFVRGGPDKKDDGHKQRQDYPPAGREGADTAAEREALIQWLAPYAVREREKSGVPASITIAQAILETGWFATDTRASYKMLIEAKNLFGMKGTGPAGYVFVPTQEYEKGKWVTIDAKFRAYHDYGESFADHTRLLTTSAYYAEAMKHTNDPRRFIREVGKNYATDPAYADEVWAIVLQYDLRRFDK